MTGEEAAGRLSESPPCEDRPGRRIEARTPPKSMTSPKSVVGSPEAVLVQPKSIMATDTIAEIDRLKAALDDLRPLPPDAVGRVEQKLRIEWNYHSNAIEGNSLTLGETRSLILHGFTARGKPMRDHLDIKGHDDAVKTNRGGGSRGLGGGCE